MVASAIKEQHDIIVNTIKNITRGDWKVLVIDEFSKKLIDNVANEDDILNLNVANIEHIEKRREMNPEMDAIYFLTPNKPHILECLLADLGRRRYKTAYVIWTGLLDPKLRRKLDELPGATKRLMVGYDTLMIDFFPRQSHVVTFRDPWSFPLLYHPGCNDFVQGHMKTLAEKITGLCVTLGEYPKVRYFVPKNPIHEASVLCTHLARFVQEELDMYAQFNPDFPPATSRPQGTLVITDRAMDLTAPLVHEFTYEAMAHDLLPIREGGDKIMYHTRTNKDTPEEEEIDYELTDKDKVWVENRHRHMKDTIEKLMVDFRKFLEANPHFVEESSQNPQGNSVNALREMMGGMREFGEMKQAYSLHMSMAQDAMNLFQAHNLPDVASVEQSLATGLDEDNRRTKNILEQVVRLLDEPAITPPDRLRLIMLWILHRDGVVPNDVKLLLSHAGLPPEDADVAANLEFLGGRTIRNGLKDTSRPPAPPPLFPKNTKDAQLNEEYALSRFEPALQSLLDDLCSGTLDQAIFPHVKPPMDPNEDLIAAQQGSLRAGRPNWAASGRHNRQAENRQRNIVFVAGGATFSESRVCYDVGNARGKDIFLATSHMASPSMFVRQLRDLNKDARRLDLPITRPKPRAPDWVHERPAPPMGMGSGPGPGHGSGGPRVQGGQHMQPGAVAGPDRRAGGPSPSPPTAQMSGMSLGPGSGGGHGGHGGGGSRPPTHHTPMSSNGGPSPRHSPAPSPAPASHEDGHGHKPHKLEKEKKKRNFLGMKKSKE